MGWRIENWDKFEPPIQNDRDQSGELKWWKCPVSQNRRYKLLVMSEKTGWQMLGIWHAIVASWGRQTRESRKDGVLRTAMAGDNPATLKELSADTLVPQAKLKRAIAKFVEMGWLAVESNWNPDGIQTDSETRLDKTRLEENRKEYIYIADCSKVKLTQEDYDWLVDKWDKARVDAMALELEEYFYRKPKECATRNHKLTINNWLTRRKADAPKTEQQIRDERVAEMIADIPKNLGAN